jgi:hypothetical protein
MEVPPYDDAASLFRVYSPEECDSEGYPFVWPKIATLAKRLADWQCFDCALAYRDEGARLTVHHENERKADCRKENLMVLCWPCHLQEGWHWGKRHRVPCPDCKHISIGWAASIRHRRGKHGSTGPIPKS